MQKIMDDSQVFSVRVSKELYDRIKVEAKTRGLQAGVYIRTILYEKFGGQI